MLADGVINFTPMGQANFSVSQEGTLLYEPFGAACRLAWFDRHGREFDPAAPENRYASFACRPKASDWPPPWRIPATGTKICG